jgi:hypothetical protein
MSLSDFQDVVAMCLDLTDKQANIVQRAWPQSETALRNMLRNLKRTLDLSIAGHDLLASTKIIWRERPVTDEDQLGREVLYHPLTGAVIEDFSPWADVPGEMLIFLRWAIGKGLIWGDGVSILRDVQAASNDIAALPDDRFWMKHQLPTKDGATDWTSLDLAEAKDFVLHGRNDPSTTYQAPGAISEDFDLTTLHGILCSIPALSDKDNRDRLLRGMPTGPAGVISRNSAFATDIYNIVYAIEGWGDERHVNRLIDNALGFNRGTQAGRLLEQMRRS